MIFNIFKKKPEAEEPKANVGQITINIELYDGTKYKVTYCGHTYTLFPSSIRVRNAYEVAKEHIYNQGLLFHLKDNQKMIATKDIKDITFGDMEDLWV